MFDTATLEPMTSQLVDRSVDPLLEVRGISKGFPGVVALNDVDFKLRAGSVHALMGENGAGKSTLMKIIAGIYIPDRGEIRLRGQKIALKSPIDALRQGIAMIHQELNLMPYMTVAENVWITREPKNRVGFVDHGALYRKTEALFKTLNIDVDVRAEIQTLSVANRQMVEIAKAVSYNSDVLIMDEPTSALTGTEVEHLFAIIHTLRSSGKGIIYITHKMNELFEIADECSVFRDGKYIATKLAADVTRDDIIKMMVGREITQLFPKKEVPIGEVVLSIRNLCLKGVFQDVSFDVRAGEIVGMAGLVGSGRSNVAETLFGVTPASSGSVHINGKALEIDAPTSALAAGMAFLTEDRKETGCFLSLNIQDNMDSAVLNQGYVSNGFIKTKELQANCREMAQRLSVKTPSMGEEIQNLSGGNQQKVLVGRWLLTHPKILILDEPTRGIDVGAKAEIHRLVSELAGQGVAILMISSEMPEVLGMSDRIVVMHEGRVTGILDRKDADQVAIMELAAK
jgi:inositol transport system ATP-binding protein